MIDADNALRKVAWETSQDYTAEHRGAVIRASKKRKSKKAY